MAHIRRHPNAKDRWQVRYLDPGGRERAKNFSRKSDAERFLHTVETDKLRGEWIYAWLKDPQAFLPDTLEPNQGFSDQQALDLTAFILSLKNPEFQKTK